MYLYAVGWLITRANLHPSPSDTKEVSACIYSLLVTKLLVYAVQVAGLRFSASRVSYTTKPPMS